MPICRSISSNGESGLSMGTVAAACAPGSVSGFIRRFRHIGQESCCAQIQAHAEQIQDVHLLLPVSTWRC